jgi:glucose-1-phosphate cytidylyltransferase
VTSEPTAPSVVILCGGMGTRLREETEFRPKPLVEIGGRPILWHIMKIYGHHGFTEFVLCLGYRGAMIKEYFLNYRYATHDFTLTLGPQPEVAFHASPDEKEWKVTFADTGPHTNTGGRIKRIERYIAGEHFLVTYGDGVADVDIAALYRFHRSHGKLATLTGVHPLSRFGVVDAEGMMVRRFREKPRLDGLVSGGFFVFRRGVFDYLDDASVLEREPLARLAEDGQLAVYPHHGFWTSMDTYRDVLELNQMWERGERPWEIWRPGAEVGRQDDR